MKNLICKLLILVFGSLLVSSCATRKEIVRFKEDLSYIRSQTELLREENSELKRMNREMAQSIEDLENETRRTKADLLAEIDHIKSRSQAIDSKLDDNSYRMSHILQKAESASMPVTTRQESARDSSNQDDSPRLPATQADLNPLAVYNSAYLDLSKGNLQLAIQGFQQFLENFPRSDMSDNAQYWIGEVYYSQNDNLQAISEFRKVIDTYPNGDKVPAALLKLGYCHFNMGDQTNGKNYLKIVMEKYPNTEEARLARSRLEEL